MDLWIEGNAALVTASSSGLGLASATALAREGANVTICGRDADRLERAEERVEAAGPGRVLSRRADITDPDDITDLVETTVEAFDGLDHVVTSAGGPPSGPMLEIPEREWYRAYDMLLMSVVWTLEETVPHLRESDSGTVVAITSTSVQEPIENLVLSNSVRRGVIGLVKTAARELAPDVRANAVLPGPHETARQEELISDDVERGEYPDYEAGLAAKAEDVPLGRIGDPIELGEVVAFLSSGRASFVNGASVPVDGGRMRS